MCTWQTALDFWKGPPPSLHLPVHSEPLDHRASQLQLLLMYSLCSQEMESSSKIGGRPLCSMSSTEKTHKKCLMYESTCPMLVFWWVSFSQSCTPCVVFYWHPRAMDHSKMCIWCTP
jgi:hypothetical protein